MSFLKQTEIFLVVVATSIALAASLDAVEVANLPRPVIDQCYYYDGRSDTIYLFGGTFSYIIEGETNYDIHAFSISNNTVTTVGTVPTEVGQFKRVHTIPSSVSSEVFYYLVPTLYNETTLVYLFNTSDGSSQNVDEMSVNLKFATHSRAPNGDNYFFGGKDLVEKIVKIDLEAETISWEFVGNIHQNFYEFPFTTTVYLILFNRLKNKLN